MQSKLLNTIHSYDCTLYNHYHMARGFRPLLTKLARQLSRSGDGYYYALVALLLYVSSLDLPNAFFTGLIAAYSVERIIYFVMKNSCKRKRPADAIAGFQSVIKPSDEFSFPSGHTSGAFVFAVFMCHLFPAASLGILAWAALVGLSRFVLGVHFITDIAIGALLGGGIGLTALHLVTL